MDPLTLLTVGTSAVRAVGTLFGGRTKAVADRVASIADSVAELPNSMQESRMLSEINEMPPEDLAELRKIEVELKRVEAQREGRAFEHEETIYTESQATIRTEAQSTDAYVRQSRPKIARMSAWAGGGYAVVMELGRVVGALTGHDVPGADVALLGTLLAPVGFYMSMRTVDGFSKRGR